MVTDLNETTKKFKILTIRRRKCCGERAHLLGLPQELRDLVYELVLIEPPLYLREHRHGCPSIDPLHGAETPVCKSTLEE